LTRVLIAPSTNMLISVVKPDLGPARKTIGLRLILDWKKSGARSSMLPQTPPLK